MTDDNREKIKAKIRALLAKTTANGATEAEAMAAAEKASELMLEYDLTFTDVNQVKDDTWGKRARPFGQGSSRRRHYHEVQFATSAIARFCDCKVWLSGYELTFFGTQTDTEIAHYMVDMIRELSEKALKEYNSSIDGMIEKANVHGKTIRANFMVGFMSRVASRLQQMKHERERQMTQHATGNALVVVKGQELARRFNALGLHLGSRSSSVGGRYNSGARSAGERAGNAANLSRGVAGGQKAIR